MSKILVVNSCKECRNCVDGFALAKALNRVDEFKGKKSCTLLSNFLMNANIIDAKCPLEDAKKTEPEAPQAQSETIRPQGSGQKQYQQFNRK
jgi:hypothetical protein